MTEVKEREVAIVPPKDHTPVVRSLDPSDFPTPTSRDEEFRFTPVCLHWVDKAPYSKSGVFFQGKHD